MGWIGCRCDAHRKQVDVKQWYNPVRQEVQRVWSQLLQFEVVRTSSQQRAGPSEPPVEQPSRTRKKFCHRHRNWGSICYSLCSVSNSPLTHNPFVTLSQPFRIKCERYIFLKKRVRLSLLCWLCFCMYMCIVVSLLCNRDLLVFMVYYMIQCSTYSFSWI